MSIGVSMKIHCGAYVRAGSDVAVAASPVASSATTAFSSATLSAAIASATLAASLFAVVAASALCVALFASRIRRCLSCSPSVLRLSRRAEICLSIYLSAGPIIYQLHALLGCVAAHMSPIATGQ